MKDKIGKAQSRANFPNLRGFEFFPEGKLLTQKVDFDGPVGIAYERCIGYTKLEHSHDRITITFPRGSSRSFIKVFPEAKTFQLNSGVVHLMFKDHLHEQGSVSSIYDTFALFVTQEHFEQHLRKLGANQSDIRSFLRVTRSLKRSEILNELIDRYFIARVLEQAPSPVELKHLEFLILTELFSLGHKNALPKPTTSAIKSNFAGEKMSDPTSLVRAIEFIESHLFERLDVPALVRASRTSQATLFRLFKRELKASPLEYVRNRRLDESRTLLQTGEYQVGDVALLVGYEDLSSFSKAYKIRFQKAPSSVLPRNAHSPKK